MPDQAPPDRPSTIQVVSAMVQNLATIGGIVALAYGGKIDGSIAALLIAAVSGLDLAKIKNLRSGGHVTLGAVGLSHWFVGRGGF